jgi:hypothetical protein
MVKISIDSSKMIIITIITISILARSITFNDVIGDKDKEIVVIIV